MVDLDLGDLCRVRHQEFHEGRVAQLAVGVVREAFVESSPDPLRNTALDLTFQDHRVDHPAAVVDDDVLEDLQPESLRVHVHIGGVAARCPGRARRAVIAGRLQPWLLAIGQGRSRARLGRELRRRLGAASERIAHGVRVHRDGSQRNAAVRRSLHAHSAIDELEVGRVGLQQIRGDVLRLLGDHARRHVHRVARGDRTTRREGAHPPLELPRVAARDLDIGDVHAQLVGDDLRPHGRMRLALVGNPGRRDHFP